MEQDGSHVGDPSVESWTGPDEKFTYASNQSLIPLAYGPAGAVVQKAGTAKRLESEIGDRPKI